MATIVSIRPSLRVLFLVTAHNSLSQLAYVTLSELGHKVDVAVVDSADEMEEAVRRHPPDVIVCPMLKKIIPEGIWSRYRCLVVHPGPVGDRGPSSLDWAIELGASRWGVTVIEATGEVDGGAVWASRTFPMPEPMPGSSKSSLYRHEVRRAAIGAIVDAVERVVREDDPCPPLDTDRVPAGIARPLLKQATRAIEWRSDSTDAVIRKLQAAEGHPGVLDTIDGKDFYLFGGHRERFLRGRPGEIVAQRSGAICRATSDGAIWITHLQRRAGSHETSLKLPAVRALALAGCQLTVREVPAPIHAALPSDHTYRDIVYEESNGVGYLSFEFYNGAMGTEHCHRLRDAYDYARMRPNTSVIVLLGGRDFFSNGIHLNLIEAADHPGVESWRNLHAIDDLVRAIVETDSHLLISALRGDAAAGGVALALAADRVVARDHVVLNPYYRHMGGLYGSEYWTYLLPRRVGAAVAAELTDAPFTPIGTRRAVEIGLLDAAFGASAAVFERQVRDMAERLAGHGGLELWLEEKQRLRARDERIKPLHAYRTEELARSHRNFFGADRSYHEARRRFAFKLGPTPATAARAS
jgi:putative two-component system protein, hydrogenase maturation factor HypX/HoxX